MAVIHRDEVEENDSYEDDEANVQTDGPSCRQVHRPFFNSSLVAFNASGTMFI